MHGLSTAQLLTVADLVGEEFGATVTDLAALASCAAASTAEINGIPVHESPETAAASLHHTIVRLTPLSSANQELAEVASRVLLARNRGD